MKSRIIFLFSLLLIFGCSGTDDESNSGNGGSGSSNVLENWTLINISGGVSGIDHDFTSGEIKWTFDINTGVLTVDNNNTNLNVPSGLNTGSYNYKIDETSRGRYIEINDESYGQISNLLGTLEIDQTKSFEGANPDGYVLEFLEL